MRAKDLASRSSRVLAIESYVAHSLHELHEVVLD